MDDNWVTDRLKGSDLSRRIIFMHLVAYPSPSMDDDVEPPINQTNHWCLFLDFGDNTSVRIDVSPGYGPDGYRAKIRLASRDHACTRNHLYKSTYTVNLNHTVTVQDLVVVAQTNGRQKYEFSIGWEGCRYWNYMFIRDLENQYILTRGAAIQAWDSMSWFYHTIHGASRSPVKAGVFWS
ncbi:hypothetical protein F5Y12DRAFT_790199 [Xylaria sp. FL1777]|nr:hypothetical protein F5Y12DRAFT_790199 [Xylaria sp. FL1777]